MATSGGETLFIWGSRVVKLYLLHTIVVVAMDRMAGRDGSMVVGNFIYWIVDMPN